MKKNLEAIKAWFSGIIKKITDWIKTVYQFILTKIDEKVFGVPMAFLAFFLAIIYIMMFAITIALMVKIFFFNVIFIALVMATIAGFYIILSTVKK